MCRGQLRLGLPLRNSQTPVLPVLWWRYAQLQSACERTPASSSKQDSRKPALGGVDRSETRQRSRVSMWQPAVAASHYRRELAFCHDARRSRSLAVPGCASGVPFGSSCLRDASRSCGSGRARGSGSRCTYSEYAPLRFSPGCASSPSLSGGLSGKFSAVGLPAAARSLPTRAGCPLRYWPQPPRGRSFHVYLEVFRRRARPPARAPSVLRARNRAARRERVTDRGSTLGGWCLGPAPATPNADQRQRAPQPACPWGRGRDHRGSLRAADHCARSTTAGQAGALCRSEARPNQNQPARLLAAAVRRMPPRSLDPGLPSYRGDIGPHFDRMAGRSAHGRRTRG
jgi:hypothetical protein